MDANKVRECSGNTILWLACNDQLKFLQIIDLNPMLEYTPKSFTISLPRGVMFEPTTLIVVATTRTKSNSYTSE